ncbi:MAG TPA: hypothetical protein ENL20_11090, partial [Candidatus Cloacimonetes bacterium]|nr:hypothetical protein [Candidatus Cloacimonadota bacterium]
SQEYPFNSIREAIDVAEFGSHIFVEDGIYYENINFQGKAIIIESKNGYENCVIDGFQHDPVVTFENGEGLNSMLSGFTIANGYGSGYQPNAEGGGIYCTNHSDPYLQNLLITNNSARSRGGGVYCHFSDPTLENITISENNITGYGYGGGINFYHSNPTLINVIISGNSSSGSYDGGHGGGMYCENSDPILIDVTIRDNVAGTNGGGIYCTNSSYPQLSNVRICNNSATYNGGGIYCQWNSTINFNSESRSNIYLNQSANGSDLYSDQIIEVYVDTFTVMFPTDFFAYPINNYTFDIIHSVITQSDSDLYVSPEGDNTNSGLSFDEPLKTIFFAKSKIMVNGHNPHTIFLAPGIYSSTTNNELFPVSCISYVSFYGSGIDETILDANIETEVIYIDNIQDVSIAEMTIKNGSASTGAGIKCYHSDPAFINLKVCDNESSYAGGGCFFYNSNPYLENVLINNNSANRDGGGICYNNSSSSNLVNVTIVGNNAESGGGIHCEDNSSTDLINVTISDNSAESGGAIYCERGSNVYVVNSILWNNIPQNVYFYSHMSENNILITHSDIQFGEEGIEINDNGTVYWLEGNIDEDPQFADQENGNYHLFDDSPCIDTGTAYFEWEDEILIDLSYDEYYGWAPDMGAFEWDETSANEELIINNEKVRLSNYPNPFDAETTISFNLTAEDGEIAEVIIYNIKGQKVK